MVLIRKKSEKKAHEEEERKKQQQQQQQKKARAKQMNRSGYGHNKNNPKKVNKARVKSVDRIHGGGSGQFNDDRSVIVNRVLSANRNKAKALHNVIFELQQHIETLTGENKDLRKAARMTDRELKRMDNQEAELPSLIKKHSEEIRVLQQKFKKQKESADKARENLKKREDELTRTQDKLRKYQKNVQG